MLLADEKLPPSAIPKNLISRSKHPVLNPINLVINAPMMEEIVAHVKEVLFDEDSGTCFLGGHRIGKTTAIETLVVKLNADKAVSAYFHYFAAEKLDVRSIKQMFKHFCSQENIHTKDRAPYLDMRDLIIYRLLDRFILSRKQQIVLFIDELHRLDVDQLESLASLHDTFRKLKINLCMIFIGNEAPSKRIIKTSKLKKHRLIFGRFFESQKKIYGIRSEEQLKKCLSEFDRLRYPEGGPTYTQHFLHKDAPKNWKLASLSKLMWEVYTTEYKPKLKGMHDSFGMKYFISTVRRLLVFYLNSAWTDDRDELREMISQSIAHSRIYVDGIRVES